MRVGNEGAVNIAGGDYGRRGILEDCSVGL